MKRLVLRGPSTVGLELVAESRHPTGSEVSIRSRLGLISSGTERRLILGLPVPKIVSAGFEEALHSDSPTDHAMARYGVSGANEPVMPRFPSSLGYNTLGVIDEIGPDVTAFRPGDRVMSTGPHSERFVLADWRVVSIPAEVPSDEAVFSYLATLGLSALRRVSFRPGENVVVLGAGIVGLTAALVAAACGARVIAVDPDPFRRDLARGLGVLAGVFDPSAAEFDEQVTQLISPEPVDHVIETAGSSTALRDAIRIVGRRGHVAILALHAEGVGGDVLADRFHEKECSLVSCANDPAQDPRVTSDRFTVAGNVRFVLEMLATSRLSFAGLLTHTFAIENAAEAYALMASGTGPFLGIGLDWGSNPED
jgi:threonine dehydrogenase-like Zn-dependent dehydrogenase